MAPMVLLRRYLSLSPSRLISSTDESQEGGQCRRLQLRHLSRCWSWKRTSHIAIPMMVSGRKIWQDTKASQIQWTIVRHRCTDVPVIRHVRIRIKRPPELQGKMSSTA